MSLSHVASLVRSSSAADYRALGALSAGFLLAALIPRSQDQRVVGRFTRTSLGMREAWIERIEDRMRRVFGSRLPDADYRELAKSYCAMTRETQWLRMRAFHTSDLPVEISLEGLEEIEQAFALGRGVILWGMSFADTLLVKLALSRANIPLVYLSSEQHGVPSPWTEFGVRFVGPFHNAAENRFLAERLLIPAKDSLGYMRTLTNRLRGNSCVYIRGDIKSFRNNVVVPILGREVAFAPGAPGIAHKLGSRLLPMHVIREGSFRYRAVIGPPITVSPDQPRKQAIRDAIAQFAELIERTALAFPSSWEYGRALWLTEWDI